jgi:hypothetical protein
MFFLLIMTIPALGPTQPPIECVSGKKRPGCEADHSPPSKWLRMIELYLHYPMHLHKITFIFIIYDIKIHKSNFRLLSTMSVVSTTN